jgi:hypothetical protein
VIEALLFLLVALVVGFIVLIRVVPMIALVRAVRRGTWQDVSALRLGLATFVAVLFTIWPWPSPAQVASPVTTPPTWLAGGDHDVDAA